MKAISTFFLCLLALSAELFSLCPPAVKKGDLIALVFPASFLDKGEEAQEILQRKAAWLQSQGYRTVFYPNKVKIQGYLAGSDVERANALMDAWKDPKVKAIWCIRGGYGTPRILDLIDYEWIKTHPKVLLGMSDITALHYAIQEKTGLVTFLAPVLNYFDEKDGDFDEKYAFEELEKTILGEKIALMRLPAKASELKIIRAGKAEGKLVGGNLTLIASLCGTKWQMDTEGKILVLEDVGEEIYRIDRMLWQLKEAGLLEDLAGVILGSWKECKTNLRNSLTLDDVFENYFGKASYPVISGFPSGHGKYQSTVPLNVRAKINTETKSVELLEQSVLKPPPKPVKKIVKSKK